MDNPSVSSSRRRVPLPVLFLAAGALGWLVAWWATRPADSSSAGRFAGGDYRTRGASAEDGRKLYEINCASCHGLAGAGTPGVFPPLANSGWVRGEPDRLIKIAHYGLTGELESDGRRYSGFMPAIAAGLSDEKLAALLSYVRATWGDGAPVDAARVRAVRAAVGTRSPFTAAELSASPAP